MIFADPLDFVELFPQPGPISAVHGKGDVEATVRRGLMGDFLRPRKEGQYLRNRVLG